MPNTVTLIPDDLIYIVFDGPQTRDSMTAVVEQSLKLNEVLSCQEKPIKTLIDCTHMGPMDPGAARQAVGGLSSISFDKVAIFGAQGKVGEQVSQVLGLSGKPTRIQQFSSEAEAKAWL